MATIDPKDEEWYAFHDWECGPGWDHYIGVKGNGSLDQAIATNLSEANATLIVAQHNQSLRSQAGVSEAVAWIRADDLQEPVERRHVTASSKVATSWAEGFHPCLPLFLRPAPIEITEEMVDRLKEAFIAETGATIWPTDKQFRSVLTAALQGETK